MRVLCVVPHNIKHETIMFLGLKAQGVDLHIVTSRKVEPDYTQLIEAGIPVEIIPIRKRTDKQAISQIKEIIKQHDIDIVHAFNNKTVSNALKASKGTRTKFIAYRGIVGNVSFLNPASWRTYLNPRVDRIICVAEAIRQFLLQLKFLWLRIPPEKLVTVYKGHDMDWYSSPPANLKSFGIPEDAFAVACIANYRPRKGIETLIDALEYLPPESNIHIVLIGDMRHKNVQQQLAKTANRRNIHCIGHQDNAPQIQAACQACILPSLKREGLPKSVIEGMAYSIPPIVTDSGGSPELIEQGISGIIVPPGSAKAIAEAIKQLYENTELRQKMGAAARKRIEQHFTTQHTIDATHKIYQELMN